MQQGHRAIFYTSPDVFLFVRHVRVDAARADMGPGADLLGFPFVLCLAGSSRFRLDNEYSGHPSASLPPASPFSRLLPAVSADRAAEALCRGTHSRALSAHPQPGFQRVGCFTGAPVGTDGLKGFAGLGQTCTAICLTNSALLVVQFCT